MIETWKIIYLSENLAQEGGGYIKCVCECVLVHTRVYSQVSAVRVKYKCVPCSSVDNEVVETTQK